METQELLKQFALVEEVYQKVSANKKVKDMIPVKKCAGMLKMVGTNV